MKGRFEAPAPIPADNTLPLDLTESEICAKQGGECAVWKCLMHTQEGLEKLVALKEVRQQTFRTETGMDESRRFYDYIAASPLGEFVPYTFYFKARMNMGAEPRFYRLQPFIVGRQINELSDDEINRDENLIRQLVRFVDAVIPLIENGRFGRTHIPDLYGQNFSAAVLHNPRFSSNIVVKERPDKKGRRVFFVDTAPDVRARAAGLHRSLVRHIGTRLQIFHLKRWRRKLCGRLLERGLAPVPDAAQFRDARPEGNTRRFFHGA